MNTRDACLCGHAFDEHRAQGGACTGEIVVLRLVEPCPCRAYRPDVTDGLLEEDDA